MPLMFLRDDITRVHCDAIVNAANESLLGGGGVDGAIHSAAGPELLEECRTLGGCAVGDAKMTRGYMLPCRYVIHTVGPRWSGGRRGEPALLASCYRRSLELALEANCESVAFPMISTGIYGYPKKEAMQIAVQTVRAFLAEHDMDVYFVMFGKDTVEAGMPYAESFRSYIDDHYAFVHEASEERRRRQLNRMDGQSLRIREEQEESLEEVLARPAAGFTETLFSLIDERGMKDSECYHAANLTRMHFAKLRSGGKPKKSTVFALAFALKLSVGEAQNLLAAAGFAFEPANRQDVVVEYLLRHQTYDIMDVNAVLFDLDLPQLGSVTRGMDE